MGRTSLVVVCVGKAELDEEDRSDDLTFKVLLVQSCDDLDCSSSGFLNCQFHMNNQRCGDSCRPTQNRGPSQTSKEKINRNPS